MSILVTGATGTIGSEVLRILEEKGSVNVSALVHDPEKERAVASHGARPVVGSFEDLSSLQAALLGRKMVILITPAGPSAEAQASAVIQAAKVSGAEKIVRVSAIKADPDGPVNNTRAHGTTEAEIVRSGLGYVFLRPNLFMQNLFMVADQIKEHSQFSFATGAGRMGMIDTRDVAACAVQCALSDRWDGKVLELTGPEAISYADVAAVLSELSGKSVEYLPMSPDDIFAMIESAGWGEWMAALSRDYGRAYAENWGNFTTENVEKILGRPPCSFRQFASELFEPAL